MVKLALAKKSHNIEECFPQNRGTKFPCRVQSNICVCLSVHLSVHLSVRLSVRLSAILSASLSDYHLSFRLTQKDKILILQHF